MTEEITQMLQEYSDGKISRRDFIHKALLLTGSLAAATMLVDSLAPETSYANLVDPKDPALASSEIKYNSADGTSVSGYLTRPKADGKYPAVVVIHENRGLNDHIRDVARRLAKEGYVALAPDLLSRQGGTGSFASSEAATEGIRKVTEDHATQDLTGAISHLKSQTYVRPNKLGVTGFCWGGSQALLFTTKSKDLAASVIYYGSNPRNLEDVKNIAASVLGHYGKLDERVTSGAPKLEEAMKQYGKSFEYKVYPGAPHSFNNDTNPERYQADAAKEAWAKTLEFFKKHLQS